MTKRFASCSVLSGAVLTGAILLGGSTLLFAQGAMRSTWSGVYDAAQADKGKALFADNCAKCHGGTLDGNDEIPPLKGAHFMADWETQTVADLVQRIHGTMPLDDPGKLNTESATAVVAYLLQQNGMPAGSAPITEGTAAQIRIDSIPPANIPAPAMIAAAPATAKPVTTASATPAKTAVKAKAARPKAKTNAAITPP
jgi:quinoprotein glucose dehydrogenase